MQIVRPATILLNHEHFKNNISVITKVIANDQSFVTGSLFAKSSSIMW